MRNLRQLLCRHSRTPREYYLVRLIVDDSRGRFDSEALMQSMIRATPRAAAARSRSTGVGATRPVSMRDRCVRCVLSATARVDCVHPRLRRNLRRVLPINLRSASASDNASPALIDGMLSSRCVSERGRLQPRQTLVPVNFETCRRLHQGQVHIRLKEKSDEFILVPEVQTVSGLARLVRNRRSCEADSGVGSEEVTN